MVRFRVVARFISYQIGWIWYCGTTVIFILLVGNGCDIVSAIVGSKIQLNTVSTVCSITILVLVGCVI